MVAIADIGGWPVDSVEAIDRMAVSDALYDLCKPLPVSLHRQCERCDAQWTHHPRYGWQLSPHTLFGCASFVCPDCQRRRA
jgi:hypothetical protein